MQQKAYNFTYRTRPEISNEIDELLTDTSALLSQIERHLYVDYYQKNKNLNNLKKEYIKKFQITARQFNSCRIKLDGKVKACKEGLKNRIILLQTKIKKLQKHIKYSKDKFKIHQKKRRLHTLENKLEKIQNDYKNGTIHICFGSKKLFKKQFNLEKNNFSSHEDWLKTWREKRSDSFFLIGSKDESNGNQSCQLIKNEDSFSLLLRLPNDFKKKTILIENITFAYGQEEIIEAIRQNHFRKSQKSAKKPFSQYGKAINYLFKKDKKGWEVFVTFEKDKPSQKSKSNIGMIGIDINVNHIALAETDRSGNLIAKKSIKLCTYGKTKNQSLAIIGDSISEIVRYAVATEKPIVLENLNFDKKKQNLKEKNSKYSRMLSSFSYNKIITFLESKAFKEGIEVYKINPAYTSIIGRTKFTQKYGLTIHQSAALVIARRACGYSERLPRYLKIDNINSKSAFFLTASNVKKHVWSLYSELNKMLKAVGVLQLSTIIRSVKDSSILCDSNSVIYRRDSGTLVVNKTA